MPRQPPKPPAQELLLASPSRRGGRREGAGRKPRHPRPPGRGPAVTHLRRPALTSEYPVHVTLRVHGDVPGLRRQRLLAPLTQALRAGRERFGFRLCHYVILDDQLDLVVEADDTRALSRGLQGLTIRLARRVNRELGRKGRFFDDRYDARILSSPTEVHGALSSVLGAAATPGGVDPFSSGAWLDATDAEAPVAAPQGWLLRVGWKRAGILRLHD